jgi:uncharacterized protein (TIGR02302 family)
MTGPDTLASRLAARRAQARRVLWIERLWPALWPAMGLVGAWIAFALFDGPAMLPASWHIGALVLLLIGTGLLLWRGLRPLTAPTTAEVDRRLERASGLRHRPLMTLADRPANPDADGAALWQAHLARAAAQVARLRVGWPRPLLAQADQRAFRGLLLVALAAGLIVAGPDAPGRLLRSFFPTLPPGPSTPEPQLQAWITPPSYTRLPPAFLKRDDPAVEVPAGAALTVSLTGGTEAPTVSLATATVEVKTLDAASWQADQPVGAGGVLIVRRAGRELGRWTLAVRADQPPVASWTQPPGPSGRVPRRLTTRFPWTAEDDYGVVSLQAELRLRDRPAADPVIVAIPLTGAPKQAHGAPTMDLTANPWAGLPVVATLAAKDAPGQTGTSASAEFVLPERAFHNPLARAVIDIRKRLSMDPDTHGQAAEDLSALADVPEAFDNNNGVFLVLSNTASQLARSGAPADVAEAQARLWALALQLDDDAVGRTAQAVQAAREALKQAEKGPLSELDRKAEALRQAIEKHLQALAEKAQRDGTMLPYDPQARTLSRKDFDKLTQEMRDAAKAGRMDEAHDKLEQLQRMLDQLKAAEANPNDRKQAAQQRRRGKQEMGAAEDMVQRETAMKQHAQDRAGKPADAGQQGAKPDGSPQQDASKPEAGSEQGVGQNDATSPQGAGQPGANSQANAAKPDADAQQNAGQPGGGSQQTAGKPDGGAEQRSADARQQRAMRRALGAMMQQFGDLTGKVPDELSQADLAMRDSANALQSGKDGSASEAQQRAIDALQKGEQAMSQQMASALGISVKPGEGEGNGDGQGDAQDGQMSQEDGDGQSSGRGDQDADNQNSQDRDDDSQRDPLGRATRDGTAGRADSGNVHVPDQMEQARTREIQTELRRRGADRTRPADELDYIDRLLKSF